ncbi:PAS domain-containing protein [Aliarcobacter thereius]|uniref:Aerotaxis receptor n=1 Tax=Aliarcobacter thereius LMG 24486 TaxID=1032240 RepID=A0A1C7WPH2_9BACT|nr:PAS domain-containing protein [Aliarcobacter thereius]OCL92277.1 Aerotaxis receptor [Aliarcobacter thereius]OCL94627.1 Aerotaxis receptor [Aliarcobacter thereius LMG 24486]QBF15496.1 PAS sensor-containing signal transduction protein [Aliarcobacter thereius LMG 24486]TLS91722.1 PAS domain-containing protein [Aliarcobacter thereius]
MSKEVKFGKDIIFVTETDEKGIIIFANDDFCKVSGYLLNELVGNPHNIVRHEDMPKDVFANLWKTIKSGKIWKGIVKNKTKNGDYYWVNATVYSSKSINGGVRYVSVRVKPTDQEILEANKLYL